MNIVLHDWLNKWIRQMSMLMLIDLVLHATFIISKTAVWVCSWPEVIHITVRWETFIFQQDDFFRKALNSTFNFGGQCMSSVHVVHESFSFQVYSLAPTKLSRQRFKFKLFSYSQNEFKPGLQLFRTRTTTKYINYFNCRHWVSWFFSRSRIWSHDWPTRAWWMQILAWETWWSMWNAWKL